VQRDLLGGELVVVLLEHGLSPEGLFQAELQDAHQLDYQLLGLAADFLSLDVRECHVVGDCVQLLHLIVF